MTSFNRARDEWLHATTIPSPMCGFCHATLAETDSIAVLNESLSLSGGLMGFCDYACAAEYVSAHAYDIVDREAKIAVVRDGRFSPYE